MNFLLDIERPVFLHFLNREATSAARLAPEEIHDIQAVDTLTICHCSRFSVNISQMIEYSFDKAELTGILSSLIKNRVIITTSGDADIEKFIESRHILYGNVSTLYPMYFRDTKLLQGLHIWENNKFSMTQEIRESLVNINASKLPLFAERARDQDKEILTRNLDAIQGILFRYRESAITKGNVAHYMNKDSISSSDLDSIGRIFSTLYFEHYSNNNIVVTPTGLLATGYLEDIRYFPHYDIPILTNSLRSLGWTELSSQHSDIREQMIEAYGKSQHRVFVEALAAYLHACDSQVKQLLNFPVDFSDSFTEASTVGTRRSMIETLIDHTIRGTRSDLRRTPKYVDDFFESAADILVRAALVQSGKNSTFKIAWDANMPTDRHIRILLLTATDTEDDAIEKAILNAGFQRDGPQVIGEGYAEKYSSGPTKEIFHARSSAGSIGSSGSELVSADAIKNILPDFVIAVGICFGLREDKSKTGDILISDAVVDYEIVRVGENEKRERGPRIPSSPRLLSSARIVRRSYEASKTNVLIGLLVSGLKLIDSEVARKELRERFPDALGGEMEASGVMAAAARSRCDWIVIKSVCDWAVGKGKGDQPLAAENASVFAVKVARFVMDAEATRPE